MMKRVIALIASYITIIAYAIMLQGHIQDEQNANSEQNVDDVAIDQTPVEQVPSQTTTETAPVEKPPPEANPPPAEIKEETLYRYDENYGAYIVTIPPPYTVEKVMGGDELDDTPKLESLESVNERKQPTVVVNASGWTIDTGKLMGLQIKDGKIIRGWPSDPNATSGIQSFVQMSDGTFKIYDSSTPPEQIIKDGGINSWTFGIAVIRDGVAVDTNADGVVNPWDNNAPRTMVGVTADGTLKIVASDKGLTDEEAQELAVQEKCYQAYLMDGGGSTQLIVEGESLVESGRSIPDFFVVYK